MKLKFHLAFCYFFLSISLYHSLGEHLKKNAFDSEDGKTPVSEPNEVEDENQEAEEVVEVENAIDGNELVDSQNPEQILEACSSLNDSFSKECSIDSLEHGLSDLVLACSDSIENLSAVEQISLRIANEYSERELSDLSECSAMVYTTSMFISSRKESNTEEQSASESLEVESLETDESENASEYE
ncbi:hypothetical protein RS030_6880 [Cryptosporidium xiaoi]|uniref:Secreted protein n=1 Tax=Cryptosporidium xiaoi TaxID=659607 RepID=A0AAV9XV06_9CRYT